MQDQLPLVSSHFCKRMKTEEVKSMADSILQDHILKTEGKGKTVLLAVQDLEKNEMSSFLKTTKADCETIIAKSKRISSICDDFVKQLNCYSDKQKDFPIIKSKGKQHIILLQSKK